METISKTEIQCPIAVKWTIPENRLKEIKNQNDEYLRSEIFQASNIPGVKYYILIYPNGNEEEYLGKTMVFLYLEFDDEIQIKAICKFMIKSANICEIFYDIVEKSQDGVTFGRGEAFCTTEELFDPEKNFFVNGELTIEMEATLMIEKDEPIQKIEWNGINDSLGMDLWNQEEDKNFKIVVKNKAITAHKCILATRSSVLSRMFKSAWNETKENKVEIKDFSFKIVEAGIKLCYHQSLVPDLTFEEKMKLLQFFDKYDIQQLKADLEAHFISLIDPSNICRLANCSLLSNARKLEKMCFDKLLIYSKTAEPIMDFDALDRDFALNLLKNTFIKVSK